MNPLNPPCGGEPSDNSFDDAGLKASNVEGPSTAASLSTEQSWRAAVARRDAEIARLRDLLADHDRQFAALNATMASNLRAMTDSTSWKVTAPLRLIRRLLGVPGQKPQQANPSLPFAIPFAQPFDSARELLHLRPGIGSVLIVSHDSSRTGAPMLALNLAQRFKPTHNVVTLLLGVGGLMDDFKATSDVVIGPVNGIDPAGLSQLIDQLASRLNIRFAIVNSIESRAVLPHLARHFIPTVALVHEFAAYYAARDDVFQFTALWASELVFPAEMVRENAILQCPGIAEGRSWVIPQGRCALPPIHAEAVAGRLEKDTIARTFRPATWPADTFVVLGAGLLHIRKGVDLFLDCAARVARSPLAGSCRFVWVGQGYLPEIDVSYSAYLADQIRRAGLEATVAFMDEVADIEAAYQQANVLLLSSRLDPMPNVAIDAIFHGLPVICMERASGIADLLQANGLAEECVAPYRDVEAIFNRLSRLAESPTYQQKVGARLKALAPQLFNMDHYVNTIRQLAAQAEVQAAQEREDCLEIARSGLFQAEFAASAPALTEAASLREYVRAWTGKLLRRKPFPGFHPGIYAQYCGHTVNADPFADYLRRGRPEGIWLAEVILPSPAAHPPQPPGPFALHAYVANAEAALAIIERLQVNASLPDLFVSLPFLPTAAEMNEIALAYRGRTQIQQVPAHRSAIEALLIGVGKQIFAGYRIIGHVHTLDHSQSHLADATSSWEYLIGGRHGMTDQILARMAADTRIGLVLAEESRIAETANPDGRITAWAAQLGLGGLVTGHHANSPANAMFWATTEILEALAAAYLMDGGAHELPTEGKLSHLLQAVAANAKLRTISAYVPAKGAAVPNSTERTY